MDNAHFSVIVAQGKTKYIVDGTGVYLVQQSTLSSIASAMIMGTPPPKKNSRLETHSAAHFTKRYFITNAHTRKDQLTYVLIKKK